MFNKIKYSQYIINSFLVVFFMMSNIGLNYAQQTPRSLLKQSGIPLSSLYDNKWAFVIGIDEYAEYNDLQYAVRDAEMIEAILQEQFDFPKENIIVKVNENATKEGIFDGFHTLVEKTDTNDVLIVFFAGHGETRMSGIDNKDLGYLIPSNSKAGEKHLSRTAISMENIQMFSREIAAKHILFLIDACYGGLAATKAYRGNDNIDYVKKITKDPSRQIITAGQKDEQVVEGPEWEHSAFTSALIDGLMDMTADIEQDGIILVPELFAFVQSKVIKDTNGNQNPQLASFLEDGGEFAFIDEDLIAGIMDIDLSGFGYITIPGEPFGATIRIDDKKINKTTPVIDHTLEAGYHLITIAKNGFKTFNKKVLIKSNSTTTINPQLKLISGIMNFVNLPRSSKISIDGKYIGEMPIQNQLINKGRHEILVEIPGYEQIDPVYQTIDSSGVYYLKLPSLIPKTKLNAFFRSSIFPGWGQLYYEKPVKGYGIILLNLIAGGYLLYNEIQYFELVNNYESSIHDYETSINQIDEKWLKMEEEKRFLETNINNSKITMYSMAGIYSYNLIDIIFSLNKFSQRGEFGWIIPIETKFGISEGTINFTCSIYLE